MTSRCGMKLCAGLVSMGAYQLPDGDFRDSDCYQMRMSQGVGLNRS